jgi:hypothetical protein
VAVKTNRKPQISQIVPFAPVATQPGVKRASKN